MAEHDESAYRRAARQKWPKATLTGDGPVAIRCPVTNTVRLYGFALLAATEMTRECSNWRCSADHVLTELTPLYPRATRQIQNWERDRDG
jgi:hypothetical protein